MVQKGGSFDPYDPPLDPPLHLTYIQLTALLEDIYGLKNRNVCCMDLQLFA